MKCKDCKNFYTIANTKTTHQGVCHYPMNWFPVSENAECCFIPKPYMCKNCHRFGNDTACMTAAADDLVYQNGHMCIGFVDRHEVNVSAALYDWAMRGYNIREKLEEIVNNFEKEFKSPC